MAENDGRVVSNFILQALRGEGITVYGDGSQTRSFCYVDDLVEGMVRMMETDGCTGPVNLGNPVENSILEFAERIAALTGSPSTVTFAPLPLDDPKQRRPDITLARELLDWQPRVPLDEGLSRTISYFASRIHPTPAR
jgi:UDP-glucuronate decarboxylase